MKILIFHELSFPAHASATETERASARVSIKGFAFVRAYCSICSVTIFHSSLIQNRLVYLEKKVILWQVNAARMQLMETDVVQSLAFAQKVSLEKST